MEDAHIDDHLELVFKLPAGMTPADADHIKKQMLQAGNGAIRQLEEDRFHQELDQVFTSEPCSWGVFAPA